jgi:hypothetical protein
MLGSASVKQTVRPALTANFSLEGENEIARLQCSLLCLAASSALAIGAVISVPTISFADEDGVSFWLSGIYGSLAAVPQQPGFTFTAINYYDSVSGSGSVAAAREITIGKFSPKVMKRV